MTDGALGRVGAGEEELSLRGATGTAAAWRDIRDGAGTWVLWWLLAWARIRSQYRRTVLGPWWITLQMAVFVAALSYLFGALLGEDLATFVPYVAAGFVVFGFLSGMLTTGSKAFVDNAGAIKSSPGALSAFVYGGVAGHLIQLAHDSIILVVVLVVFEVPVSWTLLLVPFALLVLVLNGVACGLWLGPLTARYRDIGPLVDSVSRILFFFTPIFWMPSQLDTTQRAVIGWWNPFTYMLELIRGPLLGTPVPTAIIVGSAVVTVVNVTLGFTVFSRSRRQIPYWVQT